MLIAFVFDLDDVLIKSDAKINILYKNNYLRSLTTNEFNKYILKPHESFDFSEFENKEIFLNSKPFKMWNRLSNIDYNISNGRSISDIYILTARCESLRSTIWKYFKLHGIRNILLDHIITVGNKENIPQLKKKYIQELNKFYEKVVFFDDDPNNIDAAKDYAETHLIL